MRLLSVLLSSCVLAATATAVPGRVKFERLWCALHLLHVQSDADLDAVVGQLPGLVARGVNVLILEVDYGFEFRLHPELR